MECVTCRGTGWLIVRRDETEAVAPCPDCRNRSSLERRLTAARIPPRYQDRGFEAYSVHHASQEDALTKAVDYVERYPQVERGLLFSGPCGVGKTHLAVAILRAAIQEKGVEGRFVDEAELLRRLQYSYSPDSVDTEREVMLPLMEADLLIWDDLGTGRPTDWVRETIRMVINYRYTNQKQTIMTTNWPLRKAQGPALDSTLEERIGTRLFSRVMEMCEVIEVEGPDARTKIHKAGMDFRRRKRDEKRPMKVPASLLTCPRCGSKQIDITDQSSPKGSEPDRHVELSCFCPGCRVHFLARFHMRTARIEYPSV